MERASAAPLPLESGKFMAYCYRTLLDGIEHIAMVKVSFCYWTNTFLFTSINYGNL